jgi:hypothetical protein
MLLWGAKFAQSEALHQQLRILVPKLAVPAYQLYQTRQPKRRLSLYSIEYQYFIIKPTSQFHHRDSNTFSVAATFPHRSA